MVWQGGSLEKRPAERRGSGLRNVASQMTQHRQNRRHKRPVAHVVQEK